LRTKLINKISVGSIILLLLISSESTYALLPDSLVSPVKPEIKEDKLRIKIELKREFTNRGTDGKNACIDQSSPK